MIFFQKDYMKRYQKKFLNSLVLSCLFLLFVFFITEKNPPHKKNTHNALFNGHRFC